MYSLHEQVPAEIPPLARVDKIRVYERVMRQCRANAYISLMKSTLSHLPRRQKQALAIAADGLLLATSLYVSLCLRHGSASPGLSPGAQAFILAAPLLAIPIFARLGLYRAVFRYISVQMGWAIVKAIALYTALLGLSLFLLSTIAIPRSVILINAFVAFFAISGSRVLVRWWFTGGSLRGLTPKLGAERVLIYGAGAAGIQLASALDHSDEFTVAGFLDDAHDAQGHAIRGFPVFDPAELEGLTKSLNIKEVLLAMPSASRRRKREIVYRLDALGVGVRTLPGLSELAQGRVRVSDLKQVEISDILGRDAVAPNEALLHRNITGKVVMVTGAGGSIGSELCRQIARLTPKALILFERSEFALYQIDRELEGSGIPIMGSVLDEALLESVMRNYGVETVYHAAAYKHVPLVEANPAQGVYNNVFGTLRAARAARSTGVTAFVLISTDKAVRPTNVMGASKRLAEMILQCMAPTTNMLLTMVRFGNVLGSSGSVVPLFREQIAQGGPVTVTHPDVTRYFMTIPEASQLVIQAGAMGSGGDVFVLDMGEPVKIVDLARRMVRLSGFDIKDENNPDGEIEIIVSGLRPGEKLYEELLIGDNTSATSHPLILRAEEHHADETTIEWILKQLEDAIAADDAARIRSLMLEAVDEYVPANQPGLVG